MIFLIGNQIQHLRKRGHLSQDEFANLLFVFRQAASNQEMGKSCPDLESLIPISDHFGIFCGRIAGACLPRPSEP